MMFDILDLIKYLVDEGPAEVFIVLRVRFRRDVWIID